MAVSNKEFEDNTASIKGSQRPQRRNKQRILKKIEYFLNTKKQRKKVFFLIDHHKGF